MQWSRVYVSYYKYYIIISGLWAESSGVVDNQVLYG